MELYRVAEGRLCALLGSEDLSRGIFGLGASAHEALRHLADELIAQGVWVEVTDRREWQFEELSSSEFPEGLKNTTGTVDAARRSAAKQIASSLSRYTAGTGPVFGMCLWVRETEAARLGRAIAQFVTAPGMKA